jgi:hypothetical protein
MKKLFDYFALIVCPILVLVLIWKGSAIASRVYTQDDRGQGNSYNARISSDNSQYKIESGGILKVKLHLVNEGNIVWKNSGPNPVNLSYHLLDSKENIIKYDNPRFSISGELPSKYFGDVVASIPAPIKKGKYIIQFDMVKEGITWFEKKGSQTLKIYINVR